MENMNLLEAINTITQKKTYHNVKEAIDAFKRAQIVPIGDLQLRSTILTGDYPGTKVNQPLLQQRPERLTEKLGVKYVSELAANFTYPLINGNNSAWVEEAEELNTSNINFSSLHLNPKRLGSYIEVENQLVLNPDVNLEKCFIDDMTASIWEKVESTMFNGIYPTAPDVEAINLITDYSDIISLELKAATQKINNPVYLVSPISASKIKAMTNGVFPVWMGDKLITGKTIIETPYLDGEKIILADFSRLLLCNWGGIDITIDNITKVYPDGLVALIANSYWNWGVLDDNSFLFATTASGE